MKVRLTWTRERIKRHLVQRFYVRFHMTLILASAGLAAMLGNWFMLHGLGIHSMWMRYPVAVALAYLTFLASVALWLRYVGIARRPAESGAAQDADGMAFATADSGGKEAQPEELTGGATDKAWGQPLQPVASDNLSKRRKSSDGSFSLDGIDISSDGGNALPDAFEGGGGGSGGGGGASGSWGDSTPLRAMVADGSSSGGSSSGLSFSLGDIGDLDADGIILLLLALALIVAVFFVSGYVIWFAPDILSEAVFGATLAAGLSRTARRNDSEGWVAGVVWKTWWPFAIVLVIAEAFAIFAAVNFPAAATLGQAVALALE